MNIFEWLKAPEGKYAEGVALYKQFRSDNYVQYFGQVSNSKTGEPHFDMLKKQLSRIARIEGQNAVNKQVETKAITIAPLVITGKKTKPAPAETPISETNEKKRLRIVEEFNLVNPKDLPGDLQKVFFGIKANFSKMKELQNKMKQAKPTQNVKELAEALTSLEEINYKEWGKIDEWVKTGKTSTTVSSDQKNNLEEFQDNNRRIETIKINISRANKELTVIKLEKDACSDAKELKKIEKKIEYRTNIIPEWTKELETLEKRQFEIKNA